MTLSRALRDKVRKIEKVSERTLLNRVKKRAKEEYTSDYDKALLLIAIDDDVNIHKKQYGVPLEKIKDVETYYQSRQGSQNHSVASDSRRENKRGKRSKQKLYNIKFSSDLEILDRTMPNDLIEEAIRMSKVYPLTYVFENSVRNFVEMKLEGIYGPKWFETTVNPKIQQAVKERLEKETKNKWHGKRNRKPIFYTDMEDLGSIISAHYKDFKNDFPDINWPRY